MFKGKTGFIVFLFVLLFMNGGCSDNQGGLTYSFALPWNVLPRSQFGYALGETLNTTEKEFVVSPNETIDSLTDYRFNFSDKTTVIVSVSDDNVIQLIFATVRGYDQSARERLKEEIRSKYAKLIYNEFNDNINDNFFARDQETEMIFTIGPDRIFISLMNRQDTD